MAQVCQIDVKNKFYVDNFNLCVHYGFKNISRTFLRV